jgi:hypothetical protein
MGSGAAAPLTGWTMIKLKRDRLAMRELDGRTMVLDLDSSTYFAVGGSGVVVLTALQAADASTDDLVAQVVAEYAVSADTARADVLTFLADLEVAGLIER